MKYALTAKEACAALNCGKTKFYALLGSGELTAIRLGRKVLIKPEEIARFMAALPPVMTPTRRRRTA
jgi:excisionase family DNA binding protein